MRGKEREVQQGERVSDSWGWGEKTRRDSGRKRVRGIDRQQE